MIKESFNLTSAMLTLVEHAYRLFQRYKTPEHFNLCMPCCVNVEEEKSLRTIPVSTMPRKLIWLFNTNLLSKQNNKSEIAYLLPRILELVALNEEIHFCKELSLKCIATIPYELWLPEEQQLLNDFAIQYLNDQFVQTEQKQQILALDKILIMFGLAGINLLPLLDYIAKTENFYIISSIAYLIASKDKSNTYITNAVLNELPTINDIFEHWLKENGQQLQYHANLAILSPKPIKSLRDQYWIEQGLCLISDRTL